MTVTKKEKVTMSSTTIDTIINQIGKVMSEWQGFEKRKLHTAKKGGELLLKAKKEVGHGGFRKWLWKNFPNFSERTLNTWMRIAERWQELVENKQYSADIGLAAALALLARKGLRRKDAEDAEDAPQQQKAPVVASTMGSAAVRLVVTAWTSEDLALALLAGNCTLDAVVLGPEGNELGRCKFQVEPEVEEEEEEDEEEAAEEEVHAQEVT